MPREVVDALNIKVGGVYVDATVGLGGHSEEILKHAGPTGVIIGIDRDEDALKIAEKRLSDGRVFLKRGRFSDLEALLHGINIKAADGVLFDFGASMMQFKDMNRGFSFNSDAPLDMRMEKGHGITAADIVNKYPEKDIERVLWEYGGEWLARKIAKAITSRRSKKAIETCSDLAGIVAAVHGKRGKSHPATKTFQALRIAVNDEISEISKGLLAAVKVLREGGRLCAISYHSLEDRTVKQFVKNEAAKGAIKAVTKKPLTPLPEEISVNPAARSARMRVAEKI